MSRLQEFLSHPCVLCVVFVSFCVLLWCSARIARYSINFKHNITKHNDLPIDLIYLDYLVYEFVSVFSANFMQKAVVVHIRAYSYAAHKSRKTHIGTHTRNNEEEERLKT